MAGIVPTNKPVVRDAASRASPPKIQPVIPQAAVENRAALNNDNIKAVTDIQAVNPITEPVALNNQNTTTDTAKGVPKAPLRRSDGVPQKNVNSDVLGVNTKAENSVNSWQPGADAAAKTETTLDPGTTALKNINDATAKIVSAPVAAFDAFAGTDYAQKVENTVAQSGRVVGGTAKASVNIATAIPLNIEFLANLNTQELDIEGYESDTQAIRESGEYYTQAQLLDARDAGEITQAEYDGYISDWQAGNAPLEQARAANTVEREITTPIKDWVSDANAAIENWTNSYIPAPESGAAEFAAKVADALGGALPTAAVGYATAGLGGVLIGNPLTYATGAANAFTSEYIESGDYGAALISAGTETLSEIVGGKTIGKLAAGISNPVLSSGVDAIGEGLEEVFGGALSSALTGSGYSLEDAANEFAVGATVGGIMAGGAHAVNAVSSSVSKNTSDASSGKSTASEVQTNQNAATQAEVNSDAALALPESVQSANDITTPVDANAQANSILDGFSTDALAKNDIASPTDANSETWAKNILSDFNTDVLAQNNVSENITQNTDAGSQLGTATQIEDVSGGDDSGSNSYNKSDPDEPSAGVPASPQPEPSSDGGGVAVAVKVETDTVQDGASDILSQAEQILEGTDSQQDVVPDVLAQALEIADNVDTNQGTLTEAEQILADFDGDNGAPDVLSEAEQILSGTESEQNSANDTLSEAQELLENSNAERSALSEAEDVLLNHDAQDAVAFDVLLQAEEVLSNYNTEQDASVEALTQAQDIIANSNTESETSRGVLAEAANLLVEAATDGAGTAPPSAAVAASRTDSDPQADNTTANDANTRAATVSTQAQQDSQATENEGATEMQPETSLATAAALKQSVAVKTSVATEMQEEPEPQTETEVAAQIWTPVEVMQEKATLRKKPTSDFNVVRGQGSTGQIYETDSYKSTFGGLSSY